MSGKNVLVLGAGGRTGREVVAQALAQGHNVTAFVRDARRAPRMSDRLQVVEGDVTSDAPTLADAVLGQDVVISTLGRGQSFAPNALLAQSAPRIVRAMARHGVSRLIHTSAFGVGATFVSVPFFPRVFIRTLLRRIYQDKAIGDACIHASPLDWTIVYPAGLTDGPRTGRYRTGEQLRLRGLPTIPRADLAEFLVAQISDQRFIRKGVLIAT